jgi:pimeloyl-ACP methyl ester carboxylesterase
MSVSKELGEQKEVTLGQGTIRYRERGTGEPIVFVHGFLVNGDLWRKVVPSLAKDFRCITPDWPLGSHELPMKPDADLTAPGLARLIADFLEAVDLRNVTLVGNDTGGGLCQIVVANHPERLGRLVLTPCDAFENFPPRFFRIVLAPAALPGGAWALMQPLRVRALRNTPIAFGWLAKHGIDPEASDSYVRPSLTNRGVRRDARKVIRGIHPRHTLAAAERLKDFDRPVLIIWTREKDFFPWEHAERLAKTFPNARLERVEDSYTFVSEDQPERLAELISGFAREPLPRDAAEGVPS